MQSNISKEMKMKFPPIVLIKSSENPKDAKTPKTGRGGCVMSLVAQTIANRTTTCFGREHISCGGVSVGFGWGDGFKDGNAMDFQASFLSCGIESTPDKEKYLEKLSHMPKPTQEMFKHGERIYSDFETAKENIKSRPVYDSEDYVIFKGLENLKEDEIPDSVIFTVNPIELTALIHINTSFRLKDAYLLTPQASGCQAIGCFTFRESESDNPKPVLSPIDFAARSKMKHFIPNDYFIISMPWKLFLKLEEISKKSVLQTGMFKKFI